MVEVKTNIALHNIYTNQIDDCVSVCMCVSELK